MQNSTEKSEQGFTLIELLIAMVIALVVLTSISSTFIIQRKTYDMQEQITEMQQNARAAIDMISREVRMAGYDPTDSGGFSLPYNSDTSTIDIYADIDGDGSVTTTTGSKDHITYSKATGEEIIRRFTNTGGVNQPFAENIQSFTIAYYDIDGNATATAAAIRQVEITVTAKTAKPDPNYSPNSGYREFELKSYITPPNLDL